MDGDKIQKRYLVIAADRTKARIFTVFLGNFEDEGLFIKDKHIPQKIKADNARQGKVDRHIRNHLQGHLRNIIQKAMEYVGENNIQINAVVIGGHKDLINEIRECLPTHLKNIVMGEFICEPDVSIGELTEKVKSVV